MSSSLVVHALRFNRKRRRSEVIAPSNLDGEHLIEYMQKLFDACTFEDTRDEYHRTMIRSQKFERLGSEACLMHLSVAKWGEESEVLDPEDYSRVRYRIERNDPVAQVTRAYCHVPLNGEVAYFFSEYVNRSSAGQAFLGRMRADFVHAIPDITLNVSRVFGAADWLETARLAELRINVKRKSADASDRTSAYSGQMTFTVKPDRSSLWGDKKLADFLGKTAEERRGALVEIAESFNWDIAGEGENLDGKMTLEGQDGKTTTFSLSDDPRAPYLYLPISNSDGTDPSREKFIEICEGLASDYSGTA